MTWRALMRYPAAGDGERDGHTAGRKCRQQPPAAALSIVARRSRLRPSAACHIQGTMLRWGPVLGHRQAGKYRAFARLQASYDLQSLLSSASQHWGRPRSIGPPSTAFRSSNLHRKSKDSDIHLVSPNQDSAQTITFRFVMLKTRKKAA